MKKIKKIIGNTYENRNQINFKNLDLKTYETIAYVINLLNKGKIRISEKKDNIWITHQWVKKAILLYIYFTKNNIFLGKNTNYYDKIPLKYNQYTQEDFEKEKENYDTCIITYYYSNFIQLEYKKSTWHQPVI